MNWYDGLDISEEGICEKLAKLDGETRSMDVIIQSKISMLDVDSILLNKVYPVLHGIS